MLNIVKSWNTWIFRNCHFATGQSLFSRYEPIFEIDNLLVNF